jgi:hypothetical protein
VYLSTVQTVHYSQSPQQLLSSPAVNNPPSPNTNPRVAAPRIAHLCNAGRGILYICYVPADPRKTPSTQHCRFLTLSEKGIMFCGLAGGPCSACKMAFFCNRDRQLLAWKGKGKSTDKHKRVCPELASRSSGHKLPYQVRVIRNSCPSIVSQLLIAHSSPLTKTRTVWFTEKPILNGIDTKIV